MSVQDCRRGERARAFREASSPIDGLGIEIGLAVAIFEAGHVVCFRKATGDSPAFALGSAAVASEDSDRTEMIRRNLASRPEGMPRGRALASTGAAIKAAIKVIAIEIDLWRCMRLIPL